MIFSRTDKMFVDWLNIKFCTFSDLSSLLRPGIMSEPNIQLMERLFPSPRRHMVAAAAGGGGNTGGSNKVMEIMIGRIRS